MKRNSLTLACLAAVALLAAGCSKTKQLVGTWTGDMPTPQIAQQAQAPPKVTLQINDDKTQTMRIHADTGQGGMDMAVKGTYAVKDDILTFTETEQTVTLDTKAAAMMAKMHGGSAMVADMQKPHAITGLVSYKYKLDGDALTLTSQKAAPTAQPMVLKRS